MCVFIWTHFFISFQQKNNLIMWCENVSPLKKPPFFFSKFVPFCIPANSVWRWYLPSILATPAMIFNLDQVIAASPEYPALFPNSSARVLETSCNHLLTGTPPSDKWRLSGKNSVNFLPPPINLDLSVPITPALPPGRTEKPCPHRLPALCLGAHPHRALSIKDLSCFLVFFNYIAASSGE